MHQKLTWVVLFGWAATGGAFAVTFCSDACDVRSYMNMGGLLLLRISTQSIPATWTGAIAKRQAGMGDGVYGKGCNLIALFAMNMLCGKQAVISVSMLPV